MDDKQIAIELFGLLDNIDTLDNICKDNDRAFRALCRQEVAARFDYAETDGVKIYLGRAGDKHGN
jgi:hypothetical protein